MLKVIFLDIDGVLNNQIGEEFSLEKVIHPDDLISKRCVILLNELIKNTGAKVVISSTWRIGKSVEQLQKILEKFGFIGEVIGVTPRFNSDYTFRGNEIYKWIKDNEDLLGCSYYEFDKYVILDDDSDMLLWQKNNFICVDGYCGLTPEIIFKAEKILGKIE